MNSAIKEQIMQITIDVPETLPKERVWQRIKELEERLQHEALVFETLNTEEPGPSVSHDPWANPDIDLPSVDTGRADFSINHDQYIYGTPHTS
jgi:hypothetical protein